MDCVQARQLIDERIQAGAASAAAPTEPLDAHLATCAACQRDFHELQQTHRLVAKLQADRPTTEELSTMWQAVAQTLPPPPFARLRKLLPWAQISRYGSVAAALAICLTVAYFLGDEHTRSGRWQAAQRSNAGANAQNITRSGLTYAADDVNEGAIAGLTALRLNADRDIAPTGEHLERTHSFWMQMRPQDISADATIGTEWNLHAHVQNADADDGQLSHGRWTTSGSPQEQVLSEQDRSELTALGYVQASGLSDTPTGDSRSAEDSGKMVIQTKNMAGTEIRRVLDEMLAENANKSAPADPSAQTQLGLQRQQQSTAVDADGAADPVRYTSADALKAVIGQSAEQPAASPGIAGTRVAAGWFMATDPPPASDRAALGDMVAGKEFAIQSVNEKGVPALQPDPAQDQQAPTSSTPSAPPPDAKIIKTGELRAEVDEYSSAAKRVEALVAQHGGFVADGGTQEQAGGALAGTFVIRVAPARFDALFTALRQTGRLEAENVKAADVTAQYVDLEARIKSLKIAEERLQDLARKEPKADKAGDQIKALLDIERELNRVRTEIEQHEGELRVMANRVSFSTISVTLHEPPRIVPSAQLGIEVGALDDAVKGLQQLVADLGARLSTGQIEKREGGSLAGKYQFIVSLEHFGDALDRLAALGRVDVRNVKDWHAPDASAEWARRVNCIIDLTLYERTVTLPSGTASIEVADVAAALAELRTTLPEAGAYLAGSQTAQQDDGSASASVTVHVPAGRFAEALDKLSAVGRILQRNVTGATERIAGGAAQTPCILNVTLREPPRQMPSGKMEIVVDNFESARQKLVTLVKQQDVQVLAAVSAQRTDGTWQGAFRLGIPTPKMEAAVAALEGLGKVVTRELTGLGLGELSRVHPQTLGVLQVTLAEKAAYRPTANQSEGTLRRYLRDGLAGLYNSLGLIVYGLVVMAPWVAIVVVITWLIVRSWRRAAARRHAKTPSARNGAAT